MAIEVQEQITDFNSYLAENGNTEGLDYLADLQKGGHKLAVKGGGYIGLIDLDCIYSYDVFASEDNRAKYAGILETSSNIGSAAVTLAYCIVGGSAHLLIKGDDESAVKGYVRVINDVFESEYDGGTRSVGYPFRPTFECKQIKGSGALWNAIGEIHGYSELNAESYPYNSYNYLMRGNGMANLVLSVELGITDGYTFAQKLASKTSYGRYAGAKGPEKLNNVLEDMRKRYVYPYARMREEYLTLMLGEASARTCVPYAKIAKKMHCYKNRHDLTVSTLCSFMIRRKCTFGEATTVLGLGTENPNNLLIESLAEINRLTNYSYYYIVGKMLAIDDSGYGLLITTFIHLHRAFGWNFAELCEKFHIVKDAMLIRAQCDF